MVKFAQLPKYEAYKDSGVEWIGSIPADWQLEKAKWLFTKADRPIRKDDEIVTCFRDGQVTLRKNRRTDGFTNALKEHGYQGIRKGDLVIHAMDAFAGAIGVSDSDGKSTPVYAACIPRRRETVNPYFYAYYMRDLALSGLIVSLAKGIRERSTDFRFNDFSNLTLPLPNYDQQTLIANFLDQKTAQIDAAIAIKEQQIELLKERKQIIIQQAVTQGLDPNVPMKDSGVEWIGQIPEHWEVKKLKFCTYINLNTLPENTSSKLTMRYVDIGSVTFEDGITKTEKIFFGQAPSRARRLAKYGDTVVSTVRTYLKAIAFIKNEYSDCVFSTGFSILTPKSVLYPAFLAEFVKSNAFIKQVDLVAKGMSYPAINSTELANLYVVLPPKPEQIIISKLISTQVAYIEKSELMLNLQINKFKEYKTTLINSAVTGKIKITPEMLQA